jgi:hypothetical protein
MMVEKLDKSPLLPPFPKLVEAIRFSNHNILINKTMVKSGHLVCSSIYPNKRQPDYSSNSDFYVMNNLLNSYANEGISYYN